MQKDKATKSKVKQPSPKAQSVQETGKHEKVVQDRIAGLTIGELMKRHSYSRQAVRDIINANKERIDEAVAAHLEDRQERINRALDDQTENIACIVSDATEGMREVLKQLKDRLVDENNPFSNGKLLAALDTYNKAVDKIGSLILNQQKEAARE